MTDVGIWGLLLVGVGGALGAMLRFGLDRLAVGAVGARHWMFGLPVGIATANVLASFVLGIVTPVVAGPWALFLAVGFTGSLSTFSSFALDTVSLAGGRRYALASINVVATVILGLGALTLGLWLGETLTAG